MERRARPQLLLLLLFIALVESLGALLSADNEDAKYFGCDLIKRHGYPCEKHRVQTEDGYILQMHRIPNANRTDGEKRNAPVLVQHGLIGTSDDFVVSGPGKALAYQLSDAGYDVWLGNTRGNLFSRNHTALDAYRDRARYWRFSIHELGVYDNPAYIDHVLNVTADSRLFHVGFSQGTTAFYVTAAEKPLHASKVIVHVALAPVAYMTHMFNPLYRLLAGMLKLNLDVTPFVGRDELQPSAELLNRLGRRSCGSFLANRLICKPFIAAVYGLNPRELNVSLVPVIASRFPAGASVDQLKHYCQLANSKRFRRYDYGAVNNLARYGTPEPPDYNLSAIRTPMYFFASFSDWLATYPDMQRLKEDLIAADVRVRRVDDPFWTHGDFLYGITAREKVYDRVVQILNGFDAL